MINPVPVAGGIHWVGVNDRETDLFESVWPLPRGVCYNSYVIVDDKTALIDTVKASTFEKYFEKIRAVVGGGRPIDYIVVNHMEPDHSGVLTRLVELFPDLQIVGNKKTVGMLKEFYGFTERIKVVSDGDVLDLGSHKLQFHITPMVHWPETMMTYESTTKTLFSGDAFGGFGTLDGGIFDNEVDLEYYEDEILRYFSNIVGKYCRMVQKAIAKVGGLDIQIVAATHGPVWRDSPETIINLYDKWSRQEAEDGVVIVYGSMYKNSEKMMEAVARGVAESGITTIRIHNVPRSHVSFALRDAWRYKGLLLGTPTYDAGLFPPMLAFTELMEEKRLENRILGMFGTFGWSGGGVKALREFAQQAKFQTLEPVVEACCSPTDADIDQCYELGRNMAAALEPND